MSVDRKAIRSLLESINRCEKRKAKRIVCLSRIFKKGFTFKTGCGKDNTVVDSTARDISFKAVDGTAIVCIPIRKLILMCSYFGRRRLVERKELEIFHNHSSMLFALLRELYKNNSKIAKGSKLILYMICTRVYFAGCDRAKRDMNIISHSGGKYVLLSYYAIRNSHAWKNYLKENNMRAILDSGAYSAWIAQSKGLYVKPLDIDEYIDFIKNNIEYFEAFFNMDVINDPELTAYNLNYMECSGLSPIPVFHKSTSFEVLDALVQSGKYPVIGLGGTVNQKGVEEFLKAVFTRYPNQPFHGLGITRVSYLLKYDFFSCDSSAWVFCRRKNVVITRHGQVTVKDKDGYECMKDSIRFLASLEKPNVRLRLSGKGI